MSSTLLEKSQSEENSSVTLKPQEHPFISGGVGCNNSFLPHLHPHHGIVYCQLKPIIFSDLN